MTLRNRLLLVSVAGTILFLGGIAFSMLSERSASPETLSLGSSASRVKNRKAFSFQGHGGTKTQYSAKNADHDGGYYFVECERGKVSSIYITYEKPVSRSTCLRTLKRLVDAAKVLDLDSSELNSKPEPSDKIFLEPLSKDDNLPPSEYFYFANGRYAELQYATPTSRGITRLIGYLGS